MVFNCNFIVIYLGSKCVLFGLIKRIITPKRNQNVVYALQDLRPRTPIVVEQHTNSLDESTASNDTNASESVPLRNTVPVRQSPRLMKYRA